MNKTEKQVNKAFTNATPNNLENIAQQCQRTPQKAAVRTRPNMFWKIATCALAFVLVVAVIFGGISLNSQYASAASITLDVNPSVELKINGRQRVVSVEAQNTDGQLILSGMEDDLKGCSLKVAINAIIGSMYRNGFLSELTNSVLVSVDSAQNLYQQLADLVAGEIEVSLKGNAIEASVVSQWLQDDDAVNALVAKYGISRGKAQLVYKIAAQTDENGNALYTEEQLVVLSVNELGIILSNLGLSDVTQSGTSSEKSYIGSDTALEIALAKLGMEGLTAQSEGLRILKQKLDFDDGMMVYEIEFVYGGYEYELEVGAISGAIISFECEAADFVPGSGATELTQEEIVNLALADAKVTEPVETPVAYVGSYYRIKVYTVYFKTANAMFEYEIDAYGNIMHKSEVTLLGSADDQYLQRNDVRDYFIENNKEGFTSLDKLERLRVLTQTSAEGTPVYELSFVFEGNRYVYLIDAVSKTITGPEISEYTDEIVDIIKYGMHKWEDFEDWMDELGDLFQGNWDSWGDWLDKLPGGGSIGGQIDKPSHSQPGNLLSQDQIKQIVSKYLSTAVENITWLEMDLDNHQGMACFEIELVVSGVEYEVKVNANTGSIIKCEKER